MLLPALVVSGLFAQAPLFPGGVVEYPTDAGEAVVPSSAQVTVQGGQYLVVWADARRDLSMDVDDTSRRQDIWAARVGTNGTSASAPVGALVCAAAPGARFLEPKVAGDGGEALVVWREEAGGLSRLRASVLHGDGGMTRNCGQVLVGPSDAGLQNHQVAFGPEGYLVTWEEPHRLKGRFVEADELAGARPVLTLGGTFPVGSGQETPALGHSAAVGTDVGYVVTWHALGDTSVVHANVVRDGGPVLEADAGATLFSGVGTSALVGRPGQHPVLVYTLGADSVLGALQVNRQTAAFESPALPAGQPANPVGPLHAAFTGQQVLVAYADAAEKPALVTLDPSSAPKPLPVLTTRGLASAGADALVVGTGSAGQLLGVTWANGALPNPPLPIGFAPAAQQQPSLAWTTAGWVLGWRRVLPSTPLRWSGALGLLDTGGRLRATHGIETVGRFMGLSARPDAGLEGLRAHTVNALGSDSAVSPLRPPDMGPVPFTVSPPAPDDLVGGLSVHHATGNFVTALWVPRVGAAEVVRVLPRRQDVDTGHAFVGRCAALTPGKLWLASAEGNGGKLWGLADDASPDVSSPPTRSFSLRGEARGPPCVAADGARLLVAVETTQGLETTGWDLGEDRPLEARLLPPPPNRRLGAPVVAAGPGGFVIVSEGRSLGGVRAGLAILIAHARWPDDSVSEPVVVGDLESADETNAQLVPSGGKLLLAWERFDGREAVVSRTLSLVPPTVDAGLPDAGTTDAGVPEDGGVDPTPLVPFSSCGCAADGGLALGLWLAALALSRRRR